MAQRWSKRGIWDADGPWDSLPKNWDTEGKCVWLPLEKDLIAYLGSNRVGGVGSHVRASSITYADPDSGNQIRTHTDNIPVFETIGGLRALRTEPIGENLIHFSHELGSVASGGWWGDTRLTSVTADGMLAPNGLVEADGLVADINNATHFIASSVMTGIAPNDKVALTCYARPGNKDWAYLRLYFTDAGDVILGGDEGSYYFNLATGTIGSKTESGDVTVHNYKIEEAANSYYRIGIIASNADANTAKVKCALQSAHANNDVTFPGDTTTVNTWLWGADLKKQAYFDSPVPTSGATATRATESGYPLWTLPLGLFDAEGTCSVWVRFGFPSSIEPNVYHGIVSCADSAIGLLSSRGSLTTEIRSYDGTNTASVTLAFSKDTWYKLVVKWSSTTLKMRVGYDSGTGIVWGAEVAFDGSYALGTSLRFAYGLFGPMWLRDLRIWDRVLSNSQVNAGGSPS